MSPTESKQISDVHEDLQEVQKDTDEIKQAVKRIEVVLVGDQYTDNRGLIHEVKKLSLRLGELEAVHKMVKWKYAGAVLVCTGIGSLALIAYYTIMIIQLLHKK